MPGKGGSGDAAVLRLVREGRIAGSVIDEAVRRILRLVLKAERHKRLGVSSTRRHRRLTYLARRAAAEGAVLLKQSSPAPLRPNSLSSWR